MPGVQLELVCFMFICWPEHQTHCLECPHGRGDWQQEREEQEGKEQTALALLNLNQDSSKEVIKQE